MNYSFLTVLTLCSCVTPLAAADAAPWTTDYAAAKTKAEEGKKDLLLEFTGSDWCPPCIELTKTVFSQEAFTTGAEAKFVLVALDFPRDESKLTKEIQTQNEQLAERYGIDTFPTVVLADAQGRPYAQTGFQPGGPEAYLKHLDELRAQRQVRDEALAAARKLQGVEKAKALQNALAEFPDPIVEEFYGDVAREIEAADLKDETGFKKARAYRREVAAHESRVEQLFTDGKFEEVLKEADAFMATHKPSGIDKQHIMMARVIAFAETGKKQEALQELTAMKAVAPESELGAEADQMKERLEGFFAEKPTENQ